MKTLLVQFWRNVGVQLRNPIYFDNNATTPLDPGVRRFMSDVQKSCFGNPSSIHQFGAHARKIVEESRADVARVIGAEPSEIIFTSGGTEANNMILKSAVRGRRRGHVITSSIEHPSVLSVFQSLEKEGFDVTYLGVGEDGRVRVSDLERAVRPETLLISVMHINNELGTIQPIAEVGALAASKNILFHSDAVQSFGKVPIDVRSLPVDFLTMSAHKINGPKGIGAVFARRGTALYPLLEGGHQERLKRAGTEAVVSIGGFGEACRILRTIDEDEFRSRVAGIKQSLIAGIKQVFPGARINGSIERALPTTLNVTLPGIPNSEVLAYLDFHRIAVSVGSACVAGSDDLSHVLVALGVSAEDIKSSFRISLGRFNTEAEGRSFVKFLRRFAEDRQSSFSYVMPGDLLLKDCAGGKVLVADIRDERQRREYPPIPGSTVFARTWEDLKTLPRDREVVLLCEDGYLSNLYTVRLRQAGRTNVKSLLGGYKSWRQYHRDDFYFHIAEDAGE